MSGEGITSVSTQDQLDRASRLEETAVELRLAAGALGVALGPPLPRPLLDAALLPPEVGVAFDEATRLAERMRRIAHESAALAAASREAAGLLSAGEDARTHLLATLGSIGGGWVGYGLAAALRTTVLIGGTTLVAGIVALGAASPAAAVAIAGAALVLGREVDPGGRAARFVADVLLRHPELASNPVTASVVREITAGVDEGELSFLGVPPLLAILAGEVGVGRPGTQPATARILAGLRLAGGFRETDVASARVATVPVSAPPASLADRVERIPRIDRVGGAQVLIERYSRPGRADAFGVYIAGTSDWSPTGSTTPFDFTSDMSQKAGERSGAYRAVEQAMRQEGIGSDDEVVFVGHSLGGLIAHDLAASGDWRTAGVVEVGSPPSDHPAPGSAPDVIIENDSDIVPALGERAQDDAVVVRTHPFGFDDVPPTKPGDPVPAHSRDLYTRMAALADESDDARLVDAGRALDRVSAGATVTGTYYRSERLGVVGAGAAGSSGGAAVSGPGHAPASGGGGSGRAPS